MDYGILCILPPILVIVIAILTKKTTSALIIGALCVCVIMYKQNFFSNFVDLIYSVGTNADTLWVLLFTGLIGCIVAMLECSGATTAFSALVTRYADTERKTLISTWILGVILFIDDFLSAAVRGTLVRVYDNNKIPRAMLAYLTDSTASPMCILLPFTTWAIFYQVAFEGYDELASFGTMRELYIEAIPFMFYGWAALLIAFLVSLKVIKPLGSMKKAYEFAAETGQLYSDSSKKYNINAESEALINADRSVALRLACFIIPVGILIATVIISGDMLIAILITMGIMIPFYMVVRVSTWNKLMDACIKGFTDMLPMIMVVFAALMLRDSLVMMKLPEWVVTTLEPIMNRELLPVMTFLICAALAFATGSNWGGIVAVSTIVIPLCIAVGTSPVLTIAALVSGGAFGAHMCFFCDVTVFTSAVSKIDNLEHAITQVPYGVIGMILSCMGFLICGFIM